MRFTIRPAQLFDIPYVYDICLKTGLNGEDASAHLSDKFIIGQYYAAPYLHFETSSCFILESNSIPVGYIIGAYSSIDFNNWMNEKWLPQLRIFYHADKNPKSNFEKFLIENIHSDCVLLDFLQNYPSHLHIDILPKAQNMGYGKKLISAFIDNLISKNSTGLHLAVGIENTRAIEFYKMVGFSVLKEESEALYMGLTL